MFAISTSEAWDAGTPRTRAHRLLDAAPDERMTEALEALGRLATLGAADRPRRRFRTVGVDGEPDLGRRAKGIGRRRRAGMRLSSTVRPIAPSRSMTVSAIALAALVICSRAVSRAMAKQARSGSAGRHGVGGVDDGDAQDLVDGQQGVYLLVDGCWEDRAQDPRRRAWLI
jgi:hypothetical protein